MAKTKNQLEALLDREAIRDLPVRYCDRVWHDDIGGLVDLFAKEGEFVIVIDGKETAAKGPKALKALYEQGLSIKPRPYIHNHVVELVDGKRAIGRCYLALHSAKQHMAYIGAGYYADEYVKVKGEWKFARRHFTALRIDDSPVTAAPPRKAATPKPRRTRPTKRYDAPPID
ncbi:MAG: nuclear transport factor 2 family protein [Gammaproteobacteria bacterium]